MKKLWNLLFLAIILNITVLHTVKSVLDFDFQKISLSENSETEKENFADFINLDEETSFVFPFSRFLMNIPEKTIQMNGLKSLTYFSNSSDIHLPPPENC